MSAETLSAAGSPITFDLSAYPESARMELLFYANGANSYKMTPGDVVPFEDREKSKASVIYIFFENLFTKSAIVEVKSSSNNWNVRSFSSGSERYIGISPKVECTVTSDQVQSISFHLNSGGWENTRAAVFVQYCRILPDQGAVVRKEHVACHFIDRLKKDLNLLMGFENGDVVVADGAPHKLRLAITNPNPDPLVIYNPDSGKVENLTLTLQVLTGSPARQLGKAPVDAGERMAVSLAGQGGNDWSVAENPAGGERRTWTLIGRKAAGGRSQVLNVGSDASVFFDIDNVASDVSGIGYALLQYRNVPLYGSGQFMIPFKIVKPVVIKNFSIVTPKTETPVVRKLQTAVLNFEVEAANSVSIQATATGEVKSFAPTQKSAEFSVGDTTHFILTARNNFGHSAVRMCQLTMTPEPVVIEKFEIIEPAKGKCATQGKVKVKLEYKVSGASSLSFEATATNEVIERKDPSGTVEFDVGESSTFVMTANNAFGAAAVRSCALSMPETARGTIVMWSGSGDRIPSGWALCDGKTGGAPDLRGRFIIGAAPKDRVAEMLKENGNLFPADIDLSENQKGGAGTHAHSAPAAASISMVEDHRHRVSDTFQIRQVSKGGSYNCVDAMRGGQHFGHDVHFQTGVGGKHTHTATVHVTVNAASAMPPYYALCFIMKL